MQFSSTWFFTLFHSYWWLLCQQRSVLVDTCNCLAPRSEICDVWFHWALCSVLLLSLLHPDSCSWLPALCGSQSRRASRCLPRSRPCGSSTANSLSALVMFKIVPTQQVHNFCSVQKSRFWTQASCHFWATGSGRVSLVSSTHSGRVAPSFVRLSQLACRLVEVKDAQIGLCSALIL